MNIHEKYHLKSNNPQYLKMLYYCEKAAKSNSNILLIGESGAGKEVAAKYIHYCSQRKDSPLVSVNCSSYTESLLESELFGYEEGAFTGALKSKKGIIETADKGTLFLDEIGDLSLLTQIKLLRTIENKKIQHIGSNVKHDVDFRLITATNIDLADAVTNHKFREDFFYRISTIVIRVPSLRERKEDLEDLIDYMLKESQKEHDIEVTGMCDEAKDFLMNYSYPGNIRELKNLIDRMVVLSDKGMITRDGLPIMHSVKATNHTSNHFHFNEIIPMKKYKTQSEIKYLTWVLNQFNGNISDTAKALEVSTRYVQYKVKEFKL
ncbi:sigma-54-dependent Fis family transcriptional regulator [Acidaminobacter sp. JC074]|uniref:sigma-54 interaction domain-containing protein n=1 Tax=Acidaminobacter sp. JC074 TaxID=2530199 RepID=UPI001F0FFFAF|nr:sigma-54 dependent transcriptional regulator [Acidaminobacter sp. JC074]MCH4891021.1 sigma-54-dependent Fis family transcriptional regulator [Acidaminobacter sp. JC074]